MSPVEILELTEALREELNTMAQNKQLIEPQVVDLSQRLDSLAKYLQKYVTFGSKNLIQNIV